MFRIHAWCLIALGSLSEIKKYEDKTSALKREKALKKYDHWQIKNLIVPKLKCSVLVLLQQSIIYFFLLAQVVSKPVYR